MQNMLVKVGLVAMCAVSGAAMAEVLPLEGATVEFTTERRDALRRIWQSDPAIHDFVGPGDADRPDAPPAFDAGQASDRHPRAALEGRAVVAPAASGRARP